MQSAKIIQYSVPNLYTTAVHTLVFLKTNNEFLYIHIKVKELCERADPTDSGCDPEAWRSGCERSQPRQHVPGRHQPSQQWKRDYGMEKSPKNTITIVPTTHC